MPSYCTLPGLHLPHLCFDSTCHTLPMLLFALPRLTSPCHIIAEPCHVPQDQLLWKCLQGLPWRQPHYLGLYLHSPDIFIDKGQFKWTVRRRVSCRVRVSCFQQPAKKITRLFWALKTPGCVITCCCTHPQIYNLLCFVPLSHGSWAMGNVNIRNVYHHNPPVCFVQFRKCSIRMSVGVCKLRYATH